MRVPVSTLLLIGVWGSVVRAHDIPNAQVDRSAQVTIRPGRLDIDYEVSLAELTLTQDLRTLTGSLPGADRLVWFDRYGEVTGPLDAKGFLVAVDGLPLALRCRGFDLAVEEHPRYTFHFEAALPERGRLSVHDTNYVASEGTSRLALKRQGAIEARGDDLPEDVRLIPIRPVWQLSDAEEKRTKQVEADFWPAASAQKIGGAERKPVSTAQAVPPKAPARSAARLTQLLDRASAMPLMVLWLTALGLGAAHAIQPGHGKSLVAAVAIGERGGWLLSVALALVITVAHIGGVLGVALILWLTRTSRYEEINTALVRVAGFTIAAIGLWRLGRHLGRHGEHEIEVESIDLGARGLIGLGLAGGLVPCWDAVVLIIVAEAIGRLALGLVLLLAFSLGMASVLVAVGVLAARFRGSVLHGSVQAAWERRLGLLGALALTGIGLYLLLS